MPIASSRWTLSRSDRVPGERRHPQKRPQQREHREVEDHARLGLVGAHQRPDVPVGDRRDRARGEPDRRRPHLVGGERGAQQQDRADEAQADGDEQHAAGALAGDPGEQQCQEQRRRVVERHRRGHRQRGERVVEHEQRDEAGHATVDVHAQARGPGGEARARQHDPRHDHLQQRAVEDELGGRELLGAELDEDAHQRERQPGGEHPEGVHGWVWSR